MYIFRESRLGNIIILEMLEIFFNLSNSVKFHQWYN